MESEPVPVVPCEHVVAIHPPGGEQGKTVHKELSHRRHFYNKTTWRALGEEGAPDQHALQEQDTGDVTSTTGVKTLCYKTLSGKGDLLGEAAGRSVLLTARYCQSWTPKEPWAGKAKNAAGTC